MRNSGNQLIGNFRTRLLAGVAIACIGITGAQAQTANSSSSSTETVVVTGSLIRGTVPVGSQITGVSADDIQGLGSTSTLEAINAIPQLSQFNTLQSPSSSWTNGGARVNLRGLNSTLVLVNGHRMVLTGILGAAVDISTIPTSIVQRIDVLADGGSSIYGSDAVGGVVNVITKTNFDGFQFSARDGVAANYNVLSWSMMGGTSWSNGDALIAYQHDFHNAILGSQRGYVTSNHTATGGADARSRICPLANVTANGAEYHYDGAALQPGTSLCDQTDGSSIWPEERRDSVTGFLTERITNNLTFNLDVIWSKRDVTPFLDMQTAQGAVSNGVICDPAGVSAACPQANPYFIPINGADSEKVSYNYGKGLGQSIRSPQTVNMYQVTPSLTWNISDNWELRARYAYGVSSANVHDRTVVNGTADALGLNGTGSQAPGPLSITTAIDPYNTGAGYGVPVAAVRNWELFSSAHNELQSFNVVVDGDLMDLTAGPLQVAFGGELRAVRHDDMETTGPIGANVTPVVAPSARKIDAVFGQVEIPVVGDANAFPGVKSLQVSASARYDRYSDFGGTFNPRFGLTYKPFDDLTLRGNYQTAFDAPNLSDDGNLIDTRLQVLGTSHNAPPTSVRCAGQSPTNCQTASQIFFAGAGHNLKPQTANTYSYGANYSPSWFPNFKVSATYWHVSFKNLVGLAAPIGSQNLYSNPAFASLYIVDPTIAQISAFAPGIRVDGPPLSVLFQNNAPSVVIDARRYNTGSRRMDGIDFSQNYNAEFGSLTLYEQISGTYTLHDRQTVLANTPFLNNLIYGVGRTNPTTGRAKFVTTLGLTNGVYDGRFIVFYTSGFGVKAGAIAGQTHVDSFTTVNLSLSADLGDLAHLGDSKITLDIDNLFDTDPPYWNGTSGTAANGLSNAGFINGGTVGRLFQIGIRTNF